MAEAATARDVLEKLSAMFPGDELASREFYRIGDLAREFDVSLRTLRFYEDRGLIQPKRSGSTRLYSHEDRARLKVILLIKSLGFSLVDIEKMLKLYDSDESSGGLNTILSKFSEQMESLQEQKVDIEKRILDLDSASQRIRDML
ncbi:MAG: MerR family DNA-binding transcriptional regulator [Pseudomonadota bacterium]